MHTHRYRHWNGRGEDWWPAFSGLEKKLSVASLDFISHRLEVFGHLWSGKGHHILLYGRSLYGASLCPLPHPCWHTHAVLCTYMRLIDREGRMREAVVIISISINGRSAGQETWHCQGQDFYRCRYSVWGEAVSQRSDKQLMLER